MEPQRNIEIEVRSFDVAIVTLRGEQDLQTKAEVVRALDLASITPNVLVDLAGCTFIDSSVISTLLRASNDLHRRGGLLELVIPSETHRAIRAVFELMGLQRVLPIHETAEQAIAHLDAPRPEATGSGMRLRALSESIDIAQADVESLRDAA